MDLVQFESRKRSHLRHALDPRSQREGESSMDQVDLLHCALPELNLSDIDLATPFRKSKLATPFFISGMTAGHAQAKELNLLMGRVAARRGWIFGVGSQRRELPTVLTTGASAIDVINAVDAWDELKKQKGVRIGNLGLSQLTDEKNPAQQVKKLAKSLSADAFAIHLNALQEAMQPEGTPNFRGGLAVIRKVARVIPLVLKETGCGFSPRTLRALRAVPLAAIDVSGSNGTHWGRIEGFRAAEIGDDLRAQAAQTFRNWGISTVESVKAAKKILRPSTEIWASGGVRNGLDAAKLIALGATRVGFAKPALEAALEGEAALDRWMERMEYELKVALFASGYRTPAALRKNAVKNGDLIDV